MDSYARELLEQGNHLFGKKAVVDSLWQSISDHFYPERGRFTVERHAGDEYADHLMSSYPLLIRRELGNQIAAILRRDEWFKLSIDGGSADHRGKLWLAQATKIQRKAMYARRSNFVRATKEGDHDFATFGQNVISVFYDRNIRGPVYQCWHMKDCAWAEDEYGQVAHVHRKWRPSAKEAIKRFPNIGEKVRRIAEKAPHQEVELRHIVGPNDDGTYKSTWIGCEDHDLLEELDMPNKMYVVPRWQTVSGSQYAHSPATIVGLPDARLIQDMNRILLDAGERAVDPPMVATENAVRGDLSLFAGGVTWVDEEYDERLGSAMRPVSTDKSGIPLGFEMEMDRRSMLADIFYLNKLALPQGGDMTAFEVSERIEEYIRTALPIFEPMEAEYNNGLCDLTFDVLMRAGHFGAVEDIPGSLRGADIDFEFVSPISQAIERKAVGRFREAAELLAQAAQVSETAPAQVNIDLALRDAVEGVGAVEWLNDPEEVA